jgi:hypothetical protein
MASRTISPDSDASHFIPENDVMNRVAAVLVMCLTAVALSCSSATSPSSDGPDHLTPDAPGTPAECSVDSDCIASNPDDCNICPAPDNHLVCAAGACVCACQVHQDAGSDPTGGDPACTQDSDCVATTDTCNICAPPDNHLVCAAGACICACQQQ